jgi:hypothetical protein
MLPCWGGTFDFDLEAYIHWRALEEGVPPPPPGPGRRFKGSSEKERLADMNEATG